MIGNGVTKMSEKPKDSCQQKPVERNPWLNGDYEDIDFELLKRRLNLGDNGTSVGCERVDW